MTLTVIQSGQKVEVDPETVSRTRVRLENYLITKAQLNTVQDALYELNHGRTISTEVPVRISASLQTDTYWRDR